MPHFSSVPGLKFSISTSASAKRDFRNSCPADWARSIVKPVLFRLTPTNRRPGLLQMAGPSVVFRLPWAARVKYIGTVISQDLSAKGPPSTRLKSTTRQPASAPVFECCYHILCCPDQIDWQTHSHRRDPPDFYHSSGRAQLRV